MSRQQLFAAFFFAVLLFLLYQFYLILEVFLTPLTWAALLALMFYPAQSWLTRQLRGREGLAALLLTTLVVAVVIVPTIFLGAMLLGQSVEAFEKLQTVIRDGTAFTWFDHLRTDLLDKFFGYLPASVRDININLPEIALRASNAVSGFLMGQATGIIRNTLLFVVNFFLTIVALFFFVRDGEHMIAYVRSVIPMEPADRDHILHRFSETLTAVVQGTILTAAAQGLLAGIGYRIAGVDFSVLFGVATGFLSLLPGGAPAVWIPITLYTGFFHSWGWAIFLAAWSALAVGGIDNVLRPLLIGGRTQIPTVFLFFGILGGLNVYGFLGMFLAPVVIAILVAFVRIYREQYTSRVASI